MAKVGRTKAIETPEILINWFKEYKSNIGINEMSIESFDRYTKNTYNHTVQTYFENRKNNYLYYQDAVKTIKNEIFDYKLTLYKSGKLHHQKISKDLYNRGLTFDTINNEKFILKTIGQEFPFENCKEGITIKDTYLKKIPHQAKNMVYKKPPNEIYCINIKGTNIYKVGVSSNSQRRIFDLRAANPFPIDVIHIQKSLFPSELERKIHNHLSDKHIKNEWFKVDDINSVLDIIKKG